MAKKNWAGAQAVLGGGLMDYAKHREELDYKNRALQNEALRNQELNAIARERIQVTRDQLQVDKDYKTGMLENDTAKVEIERGKENRAAESANQGLMKLDESGNIAPVNPEGFNKDVGTILKPSSSSATSTEGDRRYARARQMVIEEMEHEGINYKDDPVKFNHAVVERNLMLMGKAGASYEERISEAMKDISIMGIDDPDKKLEAAKELVRKIDAAAASM